MWGTIPEEHPAQRQWSQGAAHTEGDGWENEGVESGLFGELECLPMDKALSVDIAAGKARSGELRIPTGTRGFCTQRRSHRYIPLANMASPIHSHVSPEHEI